VRPAHDVALRTGGGLQVLNLVFGAFAPAFLVCHLYALLVFASGVEVSARPSDSIAVALRTGTRIVCSDDVLDEAGLAVPDEQEDEVEKFREFLDQVTPEDFESH